MDKDLWAIASKNIPAQVSSSKTFIFVGEKRAGKTSLIQKFFDETPKDDVPPTTALEFQYCYKMKEDKKVTVNAYELGGGRVLASMLSSCITPSNIQDTTVCICVDLS
jgi:GTPase SAR1 family protein